MEISEGTPLLLAELGQTNHLIAVAPTLFNLQPAGDNRDSFLPPGTLAFVRKLVAWMAAAEGRRLEWHWHRPPYSVRNFPAAWRSGTNFSRDWQMAA